MKYYIVENNQPVGPFEIEELVAKCIKPTDLVWCEGMSQWAPASTVEEVMCALNPTPSIHTEMRTHVQPPVYDTSDGVRAPMYNGDTPPMPNTWVAASIIVTLFCCAPVGIAGVFYGARVKILWENGKYDEAENASREAKKWMTIAFICGFLFYTLWYICMAGVNSMLENIQF